MPLWLVSVLHLSLDRPAGCSKHPTMSDCSSLTVTTVYFTPALECWYFLTPTSGSVLFSLVLQFDWCYNQSLHDWLKFETFNIATLPVDCHAGIPSPGYTSTHVTSPQVKLHTLMVYLFVLVTLKVILLSDVWAGILKSRLQESKLK